MPNSTAKATLRLDLLKPQSSPEKLPFKLAKWLLSTGRFIFIVVEALVLVAFIARFKLDADLQSRKEAIEQQIPYIQNLRPYEVLIKETQLKLSTIAAFKQNSADYPRILKGIADQTPINLRITNLTISKQVGKIAIQINGQAQSNNDISSLIEGLRSSKEFSDVLLTSVGIETGILHFTAQITAKVGPPNKTL